MKTISNENIEISFNEKKLKLFQKIISYAWPTIANSVRRTLFLMSLIYIRSSRIEGTPADIRSGIAFHLELMADLINDLRHCALNIKTLNEKKIFFEEKISGRLSYYNDPDSTRDMLSTLSLLSGEYIRSEEIEAEPLREREKTAYNLKLLEDLIIDIQSMHAAGQEEEE